MIWWFGELKYFLPSYMSGPIVDATFAHSKRLLESISFSVRTNIFRRGK